MGTVKLNKKTQNKVKILSKIISVFAIIGKVITLILGPIIILSMIVLPIFLSKININDDNIEVGDTKIDIVEENDELILKYKDKELVLADNTEELKDIKDVLETKSKGHIILYVEVTFTISLALLCLIFLILNHLDKLFKNIYSKATPFILENIKHIKKIAYLLIAVIGVNFISELVFGLVFKTDAQVRLDLGSILEILVIFVISFIFEYGYKIQSESSATMYGDIDE